MFKSRGQKLVNLLSALIVLVGGFYIILFMPVALPAATRIVIGVLLTVYFLWRLNYYVKNNPDKGKDPLGRNP